MQLEIGDYVRILDPDKIQIGNNHWNKGDITEVVGYFEDDKDQPELRSTKVEREGMTLWVATDELEYVEKVTPEEARAWVIEQAKAFRREHKPPYVQFRHAGNMTIVSVGKKRGIAKCSPNDEYSFVIGEAIALARLLGKQVPTIFLHVPQIRLEGECFIENQEKPFYEESTVDPLKGFKLGPKIKVDTDFYAESTVGRLLPVEEPQKKVITHIPKRLTPLTETPFDPNEVESVTQPAHYHTGSIDVIKFAGENFSKEEIKGFFRISAIKYVTRYDKKGGLDDLEKAQDFINRLKELES